ncbi:ribonuclease H-like domain-containing protein [Gymnopilus junonius]|uniref:ribonuclease H n=1 Tax=Gymnopilus junonius TaxID=109634 RepID=A0A9P5TGZ0_GYMJU|nr:ribonuclease H-like domain-containing protein [Gymnopilus junonius]
MAPYRNKQAFYGIAIGRNPGVYTTWAECEWQVTGFKGTKYKKFGTQEEAEAFVNKYSLPVASISASQPPTASPESAMSSQMTGSSQFSISLQPTISSQIHVSAQPSNTMIPYSLQKVTNSTQPRGSSDRQQALTSGSTWDVVYICGMCIKATGVASIGAWWGPHDPRNLAERCFGKQTRKRAELQSIIRVLEPTQILEKDLLIRTDSEYIINCFKTWLETWKENNWLDSYGRPVPRADMLQYISKHLEIRSNAGQKVVIAYIRYREGSPGTEGARELASRGASSSSVRQEPDWKEKEELLCQLNRTMIALGRDAVKTEILGPNDISDILSIEMHASSQRATVQAANSSASSVQYVP